jgi:iron complex outermembrane receptor protein
LTKQLRASSAACALLSGAIFAAPSLALAQTAIPLPPVAVDSSGGITCPLDSTTLIGDPLAVKRVGTSDTAALLKDAPGVSLAAGGGVSSLPSIHGMADDRNKVLIDGRQITSACPNHMNPATSYIDPSNVARMDVVAGITPVSVGGDSIGGTISVESARPVFAGPDEKLHAEGSLSTFYRSNSRTIGGSTSASLATDAVSLGYTGSASRARDYHDGDGNRIRTSAYATENHAATLSARNDGNQVTVQGGQQFIPYEGFPNQRMDLTGNQSRFLNTRYEGEFGWGTLDSRVYWQNTKHVMNFLSEKGGTPTGGMPMNTDGTDVGYSVKGEIPLSQRDTLRIGNEFHRFKLDDWWPPVTQSTTAMMGPGNYLNINEGQRNQLGTFAEWEAKWSPAWTTLLGARNDTIWMDTGAAAPYSPTNMMNATDAAAAHAFNAQDHARSDVNFDLTALTRYEASTTNTDEIGYARKTRSPNLYERYAWGQGNMASSMTNWFGDGNYYVGNINLKPEIAHTVSASAGWHDSERKDWDIKATPYFTYVQDYINVDKVGSIASGGTTFSKLTFANHDAEIYGLDLSGHKGLWDSASYGRGQVKAVVGWMHGETVNSHNSLYHMMPLNSRVTLEHSLGGWTNAIETQLVESKSQADPLRNEPSTPGYVLVNLRTGYQWESVRVDFGIDNLFDKQYYEPLGGVDYADWKGGGNRGQIQALAGTGRSFNAGVTVKF